MFWALLGNEGAHNRPTSQAIGKILKYFEETESGTVIVSPACSTSNVTTLSEAIAKDRNV